MSPKRMSAETEKGRQDRLLKWIAVGLLLALGAVGALTAKAQSRGVTSGAGASTQALVRPAGVVFDAAGNLFIADTDDHEILKVDVLGILSVVAGTGDQGYSGDGGPAASAMLDSPMGVAVDASGNVYIADSHNHRIRKVSGGIITTIAGAGVAGFSGDGGVATSAMLDNPGAVTVDSRGYIYIADTGNHRIRAIVGGVINTVAGNGEQGNLGDGELATAAALNSPGGVAVDAGGNIFIADTDNHVVRKVTSSTGIIGTIAGTGAMDYNGDNAGTSTALARPLGVAVDSTGNVYITDTDNHLIRQLSGSQITSIAGNGSEGNSGSPGIPASAAIDSPHSVAVNGSQIAFSDTLNNVVRIIAGGTLNTYAGTSKNGGEVLVLGSGSTAYYGSGSVTATFSNNGQTGTGLVTFYDGAGSIPVAIGTASLLSNQASIGTAGLAAGRHPLFASYAGDANNAAIASGIYVLVVNPLPVTATANPASLHYGQSIPPLTGSLTGVLAQDASSVTAVFSTTATATSPVGDYPIAVALSGSAAANYSVSLNGTPMVSIAQATPTITWPAPAAIGYGSALGATQLNATASTAGTFTYTPAAGTVLSVGSQTLHVVFTPSDATDFTTASASVPLTVSPAAPVVQLSSSLNPAFAQNAITFTAVASSSTGVPTGSITFLNGSRPLAAAVALNGSGVATLTTTSLPVGIASIAAVYSGDTNFKGTTSSALSQTIADFSLSAASGSVTSLTVVPGQAGNFKLLLSPVAPSATFPATISLSLSGLPAGASYTISPQTIAAGQGATPVTISIQTASVTTAGSAGHKGLSPAQRSAPFLMALLLLPWARRIRRCGRRMARLLCVLLLVACGLAGAAMTSGCSGGFFGQTPRTCNLTLTATSGNLSHSTNLTLTIE